MTTDLFCKAPSGRYRKATATEVQEANSAYVARQMRGKRLLGSPGDTRRFLQEYFQGAYAERFACVFLNARNAVISAETMFYGTIDGTSVHPREVVRRCLELNAAALIVAHNHPSGVAEPSHADRSLTRRLHESVALVDVRLLDHFVIGDGETVSFAERGWM
jgi:DNA repair protein RadC